MEAIRILAYLLHSAPLFPRFSDENMVRIHEQVEEVDIGSGVASTWNGGQADEVRVSAGRISELVGAMKEYT